MTDVPSPFPFDVAPGQTVTKPISASTVQMTWQPADAGPIVLRIHDAGGRGPAAVTGSNGSTGLAARFTGAPSGALSISVTNNDTIHTASCRG